MNAPCILSNPEDTVAWSRTFPSFSSYQKSQAFEFRTTPTGMSLYTLVSVAAHFCFNGTPPGGNKKNIKLISFISVKVVIPVLKYSPPHEASLSTRPGGRIWGVEV
jgi:hypothetical protein